MVYIYPSLTQNFALIEYHVAWLRNDTVRMTNCLQTQPHWMSERRAILGSLPMSRVFLPGTHDSASYVIHVEANSENFIDRYVITQVNSKLIIQTKQLLYLRKSNNLQVYLVASILIPNQKSHDYKISVSTSIFQLIRDFLSI